MGRCRGRRQPSERASASLIPPQIQILKLGKTKAGEKSREAGVMNERPREGATDTVPHTDSSTDPWVAPGACPTSARPTRVGRKMFGSSPSGAPLQRIARAPWAPSYDHRATRSPYPYPACL